MSTYKKSPFERYKAYINELKESGGKLPCNQFGDLNITAVASACGNRRQWFSENNQKIMPDSGNKTLASIIQQDMNQIGTEQKTGEDADVSLSKQSTDTKKENARLLRKIDLLTADIVELKSENEALKLEKKISNDENKEQINSLEDSGRSFRC